MLGSESKIRFSFYGRECTVREKYVNIELFTYGVNWLSSGILYVYDEFRHPVHAAPKLGHTVHTDVNFLACCTFIS